MSVADKKIITLTYLFPKALDELFTALGLIYISVIPLQKNA